MSWDDKKIQSVILCTLIGKNALLNSVVPTCKQVMYKIALTLYEFLEHLLGNIYQIFSMVILKMFNAEINTKYSPMGRRTEVYKKYISCKVQV